MQSENTAKLTTEIIQLIESHKLAEASRTLFANIHQQKLERPEIDGEKCLLVARLLDHIGEYSEAMRLLLELMQREKIDGAIVNQAKVRVAVLWSRLGESQKAQRILESVQDYRSLDEEYTTLYLGHLMTIASDLNDEVLWKHCLKIFDALSYGEGIEKDEMSLWKGIFSLSFSRTVSDLEADIQRLFALKERHEKKSYDSYLYLRVAGVYESKGQIEKAHHYYMKSRTAARDNQQSVALLMVNDKIINMSYRPKTRNFKDLREEIIRESCIIAGQLGIGVIPCRLASNIWNYSSGLSDGLSKDCHDWMMTERFIPNLNKLAADDFEEFSLELFRRHGDNIFGTKTKVYKAELNQKDYDLTVESSGLYPMKFAVQCKGGRSTKYCKIGDLHRLLDKKGRTFSDRLTSVKGAEFQGYVFVSNTLVTQPARKWLNERHQTLFGHDCRIVDSDEINRYLNQDMELRRWLALRIDKVEGKFA